MRFCALALIVAFLISSCASTTTIHSQPEGAKIYIDGENVGKTPYSYTDSKIVGSNTHIRLVKEGFEDYNANLTRSEEFDVGACIGGVFLLPVFLWIEKYKPEHHYDLEAKAAPAPVETPVKAKKKKKHHDDDDEEDGG